MHNILKIACLGLTLTAIGGCDLEDTDPRGGELADPIACGGFGGLACPDGLTCVDDPADDCDPANGGADCLGVCEPAPIKHPPKHPPHPPHPPKPPKPGKPGKPGK